MSHRQNCHCNSCDDDYGIIGAMLWLIIFGFVVSVIAVIIAAVVAAAVAVGVFLAVSYAIERFNAWQQARREAREQMQAMEARVFGRTPGYPAVESTQRRDAYGPRAIEAAPPSDFRAATYEYGDLREAFSEGHVTGWLQGYEHGSSVTGSGAATSGARGIGHDGTPRDPLAKGRRSGSS